MAQNGQTPSPQQLTTLVELISSGAAYSAIEVSSSGLGKALGLTQQAASKRLLDLERSGLIERVHSGRGLSVRLTETGLQAARSLYGGLKAAFDGGPRVLTFRGSVFTGFKEGGYYVSLDGYAKHFREAFGFEPYPGTLNLKLSSPAMVEQWRRLKFLKGVDVPGFEDGRRTYGPVKCFRANVGGRYPGAVLAIERTHYDNSVLEVISPLNLRRVLRLKDGDECSVTTYLE